MHKERHAAPHCLCLNTFLSEQHYRLFISCDLKERFGDLVCHFVRKINGQKLKQQTPKWTKIWQPQKHILYLSQGVHKASVLKNMLQFSSATDIIRKKCIDVFLINEGLTFQRVQHFSDANYLNKQPPHPLLSSVWSAELTWEAQDMLWLVCLPRNRPQGGAISQQFRFRARVTNHSGKIG